MHLDPPSGRLKVLIGLALVGLILSFVALLGVLAVGSSYFPENDRRYLVMLVAGAAVLVFLTTVLIRRLNGNRMGLKSGSALLVIGIVFAGFGLVSLATNPGNWLFSVFPALTGIALIILGSMALRRRQGTN